MANTSTEREFMHRDGLRVRVVRSPRRTRTVSAAWRGGMVVVSIPARLSSGEEAVYVEDMVRKIQRKRTAVSGPIPDEQLMARATELNRRYLRGLADPTSVRWVRNQNSRWGSASLREKTIRLSHRLMKMPAYVQDYVLVHELAHLVEPLDGHGQRFKAWLACYPRGAEASAFLAGVSFAGHAEQEPDPDWLEALEESDLGGDFDESGADAGSLA
ncbi:M48 metallopeptidase family protein [Paeniglutamicibacter cryotolerans]|uniref:YgjP-like metallopeptidase domain-containing protein n=1 Tax=Paeniglutamicibacter cryotolerans TaxID=670079 RepID=A0A839QP59_9MICC|nr:M48 family metallopeptidase [Paeniglutamicibacter cryotolerans]MBB2996564.1 hypothetical protein [Paeniglutamicibacter cryotolerans]